MERALILDFGGVISRTLFETHPMTEKALGLAPGTLTWRGPFEPASDSLWQAMQNDQITEREYWQQRTREVAELVGAQWSEMSEFVIAARGSDPMSVIRPEALAICERALKGGCRLALLSNELDLFYGAEFRTKLPFLQDFEVIVDATYTGVLKPKAEAYLDCLGQLDLPAENCVFVDDQLRNIVGAQNVNLPSVHFDVLAPGDSYTSAIEMLGLGAIDV
jgi:putative hydrolase of the HAD superfamily|tara:strand:+ start:258 stop:917 length:660 start_codon:yes stop_codon:yes gene_type:complete